MKKPRLKEMLACTWTSASIGAMLVMAVGAVILLVGALREPLANLSYDLLFALRPNKPAKDVAMVYMDDLSLKNLPQTVGGAWDRKLHAQLLERLTAEHARAVVFDIVFDGAGPSPTNDARFARAIKANGRVVLAAIAQTDPHQAGVSPGWLELPYEPFRQAAAGWGIVNVTLDTDDGIREAFPELDNVSGQAHVPTLAWKAAEVAGAKATKQDAARNAERSLNYYGPPGWLPGVSYYRALQPDGVPPGFFNNRVVFVGAKFSADYSGKKDKYATAYTRWGWDFSPGVEIQATSFLNLLHHDWWTRLHPALEFLLILVIGLVSGATLVKLHPVPAVALAAAGLLAIFLLALLLAWVWGIWFDWFVAVPQVSVALLWAILCTSLKLYVDKQVLLESLAHNLSPACVKEILKRPDLLRPGATKQEVSILFSDIASFSKITGRMDADDLFALLNKYYESALKGIHESDGTVLQLIGDAIFAVWNAPLPQPDHHERTCRAALTLRDHLLQFDVSQQSLPLRTRVGLHAGMASVGNLGSAHRFEYSAIGDNTNLASRLEGLNKQLGTEILASRDIQKHIENKLLCRLVGHFKFKGVDRLLEVHELLGHLDLTEPTRAWREAFARGLFHFQRRQFDPAEAQFKLANQIRCQSIATPTTAFCASTEDGPSLFYLAKIETFRKQPPNHEWNGEIELTEK